MVQTEQYSVQLRMCLKNNKMAFSLADRIKKGDEKAVLAILQNTKYANVDLQNGTALFWACVKGYLEIVKLLIHNGDDVNAKNAWQSTALHAASDANRPEIVRYLIQHGANINARSHSGDTSCHLAAYRGYQQVVQILIENGASITILNDKRRTCLQEALHSGNENLIYYLQTVFDIMSTRNSKETKTIPETEPFGVKQHRQDCDSRQKNIVESLVSRTGQSSSSIPTTSGDSSTCHCNFDSSDCSSSLGNSLSTNATFGSDTKNSIECVYDSFPNYDSQVDFGLTGGSGYSHMVTPREPTESADFSYNDDSSIQNDLSLGRSSPPIRLTFWNIVE